MRPPAPGGNHPAGGWPARYARDEQHNNAVAVREVIEEMAG
jgi:hypothetical protein